jgi:hypothetical protein
VLLTLFVTMNLFSPEKFSPFTHSLSPFTHSVSPFARFNAPFTFFLTFFATDSLLAHPIC